MKNLKRVLSLGLASVMLLGMMVVGASAKDFTDAEDIVHSEAVQVMVALNIINGKEDGSYFAPKDTVTRGEMAKMIAVAMNGGSETNTGVKTTPSFTDIGGHWAEGWIEYCADMKIINGRGDGTFDPNGTVTGVEALKMVLTALGYEAEAYGLTGASWASQTIERARQTGYVKLVDELSDVTLTAPATRDVAAQMIWNGLQAEAVTTTPSQNKSNGETTWIYGSTGVSLLTQRYDANIFTGIFEGNWNTGVNNVTLEKGEIAVKGEVVTIDKNGKESKSTVTAHFPSDLAIDNIGEEVKVVWKDGSRGVKDSLDSKDTIFGVFNTGATRVIRSQLSKVKDNKSTDKILNIDGTKYDVEDSVDYVVNYTTAVPVKTVDKDDDTKGNGVKEVLNADGTAKVKGVNDALTAKLKVNSGYPIKVTFDIDSGKVNKVYVTETYIGVVSAINSTDITIAGDAACNLKIADHDVEDGLAKNDVVAITPYYGTKTNDKDNDKLVVTVKKADKVSGELVSGKAQETLTLDNGKDYKINYKNKGAKYQLLRQSVSYPSADGKIVDSFPFEDDDKLVGEDFDLYLVNGYVMAAIQTTESASNYSIITEVKTEAEAGATFGGLQLQVMGADGSKEIITVSKDSTLSERDKDKKVDSDDYRVGDIITYTFNDDDEAKVNVEATVKASGTVAYDDKAKTINKLSTSADCVFFAQTKVYADDKTMNPDNKKDMDAKWKVYTLRELDGKTWTAVHAIAKDDDGKVVAVMVDVQGRPSGASEDTVYGIVSKYVKREKDFWVYTVQSNGEEYTVKVETTDKKDKQPLAERDLVTFNPTADNTYGEEDIDKVKDSVEKDEHWLKGFVKEYSDRDRTLTLWDYETQPATKDKDTGVWHFYDKKTGDIAATPAKTYAIDKDAQIIYVDLDAKTSSVSSINAYNQTEGDDALANVGYILDGDDVIQVLFVETSGKRAIQQ